MQKTTTKLLNDNQLRLRWAEPPVAAQWECFINSAIKLMTGAGQAHSDRWVWPPPLGTPHRGGDHTRRLRGEEKNRTPVLLLRCFCSSSPLSSPFPPSLARSSGGFWHFCIWLDSSRGKLLVLLRESACCHVQCAKWPPDEMCTIV